MTAETQRRSWTSRFSSQFSFSSGTTINLGWLRLIVVATLSLAAASFSFSQTRVSGIQTTLPLSFEANRGQAQAGIDFVAQAKGYIVYLRAGKATLHLDRSSRVDALQAHTREDIEAHINLVGSNEHPDVQGADKLPGYSNYLFGPDPDKWVTHVTQFAKVRYTDVYPGIDIVYHGNHNHLEQDFVVHPGTDAGQIRLAFPGTWKVAMSNRGALGLRVGDGEVQLQRPRAYQLIAGKKVEVVANYVLQDGQALFRLGLTILVEL
jgi:hypothetical protein